MVALCAQAGGRHSQQEPLSGYHRPRQHPPARPHDQTQLSGTFRSSGAARDFPACMPAGRGRATAQGWLQFLPSTRGP